MPFDGSSQRSHVESVGPEQVTTEPINDSQTVFLKQLHLIAVFQQGC